MRKPARKEWAEVQSCFQDLRGDVCVENSKRRHTLSPANGHFKFFEKLLTARKIQEPVFFSKASARGR